MIAIMGLGIKKNSFVPLFAADQPTLSDALELACGSEHKSQYDYAPPWIPSAVFV